MRETESERVVLSDGERRELRSFVAGQHRPGLTAAVERILADRHAALLAEQKPAPLSADLEALRVLLDAATPGPWEAVQSYALGYFDVVYRGVNEPDDIAPTVAPVNAALIAAAVNALPGLIAELAAGRREAEEAQEKGYWIGYGEGKDEAETRDLSFDALTERAEAAEAELAASREALARVEALANAWTHYPLNVAADGIRAALGSAGR